MSPDRAFAPVLRSLAMLIQEGRQPTPQGTTHWAWKEPDGSRGYEVDYHQVTEAQYTARFGPGAVDRFWRDAQMVMAEFEAVREPFWYLDHQQPWVVRR